MILNAMMMSEHGIYMVRKLVGVFYALTELGLCSASQVTEINSCRLECNTGNNIEITVEFRNG